MKTESKVTRVVRLLTTGHQDEIKRWDVFGRFHCILQALRYEGVYEEWMYDRLLELNDSAKSSL